MESEIEKLLRYSLRREKMRTRALQKLTEDVWLTMPTELDFVRADGRCECEACGFTYNDHPTIAPENCPTLIVLCSGKLVKT